MPFNSVPLPVDVMDDLPSGAIAYRMPDHSAHPYLPKHAVAVIDVEPHTPIDGALYLVRWSTGRASIRCARLGPYRRVDDYQGIGPGFVVTEHGAPGCNGWMVGPAYVPETKADMEAWLRSGLASTSEGPYLVADLKSIIVGRVVGVMREISDALESASPPPGAVIAARSRLQLEHRVTA
jgi:hypothetical protein